MFSEEKILTKSLHLSKGYNASRLLAEVPDKGWMKRSINRLFQKLRETGTVDRCVGSGRPRSAWTEEKIDVVDDLIEPRRQAGVHLTRSVAPNSPDLNPLDYRFWGLMQEHVYKTAVPDVSQLKHRLIDTWSSLSQDVIDDAIDQRRVRLRACVWRQRDVISSTCCSKPALFRATEPPKAFRRRHSAFAYT